MTNRILITGGAAFIGSHLADELFRHEYQVRAQQDRSKMDWEKLAEWLQGQIAVDHVPEAHAELTMQGLTL